MSTNSTSRIPRLRNLVAWQLKKAGIAAVVLIALMLGFGGLLAALHAQAPTAPSANKDQSLSIKGRVLDPDGKPLAGAKVYVSMHPVRDKSDPKIRSETGADGRFVFTASRAEVDQDERVVAIAPPYGPDWASLKQAPSNKELTLRLVKDDAPIMGRVLDLEGRPVAGASVLLVRVLKMPDEDLTPYLKELQANPKDKNAAGQIRLRYERNMTPLWRMPGASPTVKTGPEGRFELRGFGRDRVVHLDIEGPGIESRSIIVMTRPGLDRGLPRDTYGPILDHLAGPSKPICGTVREKGTGRPLAGIRMQVTLSGKFPTTDEQGRYKFDGIAKRSEYTVSAVGKPYFSAIKRSIADTPGLDPLVVDFELERGIEIIGHIRNKATGEPICPAWVNYHVRADNPNFKKLSSLDRRGLIFDPLADFTKPDGSFAVVAFPGPGYLVVLARDDDYRKPDPHVDLTTLAPPLRYRPPLVHACVRIDPSENDPKSTRCEITLEPATPITAQVLDPEGNPLSGYFVAGLTGSPIRGLNELNLQETSSFQVRGLDPGRPRTLAVIHPKKSLGKVVTLRENQTGPLRVRLEPLGAVAGRVLDAEGRPQSGLQVRAFVSFDVDENLVSTISRLQSGLTQHQPATPTKTDDAGKFRLDGLVSGLKYLFLVSGREGNNARERILIRQNDLTVESGKTKDLGDLNINSAPKEAQERP